MKKTLNIILLIAVLGLWGSAGYKFLRNYFFMDTATVSSPEPEINFNGIITQRDTFLLEPVNHDPFLNKLSTIQNELEKETPKKKYKPVSQVNKIKQPTAIPVWPDVSYYGFIKSGQNKELALLKINGNLFRLHKGDSKDGIVVKEVYRDSVKVDFKKERRNFWRQGNVVPSVK